MHRCIAKKVFILTHDFPSQEAFAEATNRFAAEDGGILDSLDAGDAMGFWVEHSESNYWTGENGGDTDLVIPLEDHTITIESDWELYRWNTAETPDTIGKLIQEIGIDEFRRRIRDEFGE